MEKRCHPFLRVLLVALIFCLSTVCAQARHALYAITPQDSRAGGFTFKVAPSALPDGTVKFQVTITEWQASFNAYPLTEVGRLKSTQTSRSIADARKVAGTRQGKSLVCVFTVDQKSLSDPDFCFLFANLEHAAADKLLSLIPADFVFARLGEFAPKHHSR